MSFNYKSVTPFSLKPSKLEKYKEKLKEREIFNNNYFDRFNVIGGGSPLRNRDGSLKTKRFSMLNDNYEDIIFERNKRQIQQNNNNFNNNNYNYANSMFTNMNEFQKLQYQLYLQMQNYQHQLQLQRSRSPDVNNYYRNPYYQINNNYNNNNPYNEFQQYIINKNTYGNYQNMDNFNYKNTYLGNMNSNPYNYNNNFSNRGNFHYNENPQLLNNLNRNNLYQKIPISIRRINPDFNQNINDYEGIGIIPRDHYDEKLERAKKIELRNEWFREMNENKIRNERKKLKEIELDQKADEKWRKEIEQEMLEIKMEKEKEREKNKELENQSQAQSSILQNLNINRVKSPYYNI